MMIVLLECLTVILESINSCKAFLSPTLKTLLYLMFMTKKYTYTIYIIAEDQPI